MAKSTWGSKRQKRRGVWELRYTVAGKPKSETFRGTAKEADRRLMALRLKYERAAEDPRTALEDIRARDVQEWLSGMTFGTAKHAKAIFRIVLNRAGDLEYIDHHPLGKRYIMPTAKSARQRSSDTYDPDELDAIFRECEGEIWEPYYILAAFGGAQRAEAIDVRAPEIEWRENESGLWAVCPVLRGVHLLDGEVTVLDRAKSDYRTEPLIVPPPYSLRLKEITDAVLAEGGTWLVDDGFGGPIDSETVTRAYKRWLSLPSHRLRALRQPAQLLQHHVAPEGLRGLADLQADAPCEPHGRLQALQPPGRRREDRDAVARLTSGPPSSGSLTQNDPDVGRETVKSERKYAKAEEETPVQRAELKSVTRPAPTLNPKVEGSSPSWCTTEMLGQRLIVAGFFCCLGCPYPTTSCILGRKGASQRYGLT